MSSYLDIYVKPKDKPEGFELAWFSRSSSLYDAIYENTHIRWYDTDEKVDGMPKNVIELTEADLDSITSSLLEDINKAQARAKSEDSEWHKNILRSVLNEYFSDKKSVDEDLEPADGWDEYIDDLKRAYNQIGFLYGILRCNNKIYVILS